MYLPISFLNDIFFPIFERSQLVGVIKKKRETFEFEKGNAWDSVPC